MAYPLYGILGRWVALENIEGQDVRFQLRFNFNAYQTEMSATCLYPDGAWLQARAGSATAYQGNEIYIQQNSNAVIDDGFHFCRATLQPARWTAYFDGIGRLILFVNVPYQSRLTLVRDEI